MHLTLSSVRTASKAAAHARSARQPCRHAHPAHARLDDGVRALSSWTASGRRDAAEGLAIVEALLSALGELLDTPRAALALGNAASGCSTGSSRSRTRTARSAPRCSREAERRGGACRRATRGRRGGDRVSARPPAGQERDAPPRRCNASRLEAHDGGVVADTEVIDMVAEAAGAVAQASGVVFLACAAMSPKVTATVHTVSSHNTWIARLGVVPSARKAAPETAEAALERLDGLEDRISGLESGSEKVFKRLLQARVSFLNIHNPL
ncbi:hypothetical protein EJB05_23761, partial [Eragrostis curvula]